MSDVRARLAEALLEDRMAFWGFPPLRRKAMALQAVDALLSLPGIAIVDAGDLEALRSDAEMWRGVQQMYGRMTP